MNAIYLAIIYGDKNTINNRHNHNSSNYMDTQLLFEAFYSFDKTGISNRSFNNGNNNVYNLFLYI